MTFSFSCRIRCQKNNDFFNIFKGVPLLILFKNCHFGNRIYPKHQKEILKKVIKEDVLKRKGFDKPIHKRKFFDSNARMMFEDDFAPPHKTNANQKFKEENFNRFTSVLHRYRGKHPLYFGAKWDDFWWVERFWAILCNEVYREPRPKTIKTVSEKTLIKLVHQSPAQMHEIFKEKGGRIPTRWNYK